MALAQIEEIGRLDLLHLSAELGDRFLKMLRSMDWPAPFQFEIRGLGLMAGIELRLPDGAPAASEVLSAVKLMLREGFILLPEGEHANVITFTPPLTISERP